MLENKALLVQVKKSRWAGTKQNAAATAEYTKSKGADEGAGYWVDRLIDVKHPAFKAVTTAYGEIDKFHKGLTMPWDDKLRRLLPSRLYPEHSAGLKKLIKEANKAVSNFAAVFPELVEDAKRKRGPLFNPEDYPSVTDLIDKHSIEVEVDPMPRLDTDFRTTLTEADLKAAEDRATEKFESAMGDIWNRIADVVGKMGQRLSDPDKIFRDSLINNVRDLARLLPDMNITGNPDMDAISERINSELLALEPQQLRDNPDVRKKTAESADDILAQMAGYTGQQEKEAA